MDTKGHEEVAVEIGLPLLERAIRSQASLASRAWRLQALYLGNWLTDVSQSIDPVAEAELLQKLRQLPGVVDGAARAITAAIPLRAGEFARARVRAEAKALNASIDQHIRALEEATRGGRKSRLSLATFKVFRTIGYFKFVHPTKDATPRTRRMSYDAFGAVFAKRYTQYYPHEHLDRWPAPSRPNEPVSRSYAGIVMKGTRTPAGHGAGSPNLSPHMYLYLGDDVYIAASTFARVDRSWAREFLSRARWTSDEDAAWNEGLAVLGHALHAVEDFFVHSNFVEHALAALGDASLLPKGSHAKEIVAKRLKRYTTPAESGRADFAQLPNEPEVATGFFDFVDTLFSLRHIAEEMFGPSDGNQWTGDDADDVRRLLAFVAEALPQRLQGTSATHANARRAAEAVIADAVAQKLPFAVDLEAALKESPPEVRDDLLEGIALLAEHDRSTLAIFDLYRGLKFLTDVIKAPATIVKWFLVTVLGLPPDLVARIEKVVTLPIARLIDGYAGRYRVGSHSLLAKDYAWGEPELDQIWMRAKDCAKYVHYLMVESLTRWARSGENAQLDWLELLEFYLRHPCSVSPRWWEPVLRRGWKAALEEPRPHIAVPIRRGAEGLDAFVSAGEQQRAAAERFYDSAASPNQLAAPLP